MKIIFKKGILGFEELKEYTLTEIENSTVFKEITSIDEENIGFILISPFEIDSTYDIKIDDNTVEELELESPEDVFLYSIVTLTDSIENSTVNLRAPIVINRKNNLAKQIVLQDEAYEIKHPLMRRQ